jgi:glycerol-3-phosphate acyltransferase PlsY
VLDWVPRSATAVGVLAGPLILLGYLAGSVPFAYLYSRRRLRRQLDYPEVERLFPTDRGGRESFGVGHAARAWGLPALATLSATTLAWHLTLAATPGANTFSAVGIFSNQAIGAWVSVALWTGLAAVVGHAAPVWTGFRGGSGLPPAVALAAAYTPVVVVVAGGVALVAYGLTRRPLVALVVALPAMVAFAYVAWLADLQAGWGITNGPETTLWTVVLAGTVFARNLRAGDDRPPA